MRYLNKTYAGLFASLFVAGAVMTGCEDDGIYAVDAPDWLSAKIDSIAAANVVDQNADSVKLDITIYEVGNKDCSTAWNGAQGQSFAIPVDKKLTLEFVNRTSGNSNWNNWNLGVTNNETTDGDNVEYFVLRSDKWALAGKTAEEKYVFDNALLNTEYPMSGSDIDWATFLSKMQGAYVTLEIDHSVTGNVFITATQVATDGTVMIETAQSCVPAEDLYVFLIADGSCLEMKKAVMTSSEVKAVDDVMPVAIAVSGVPKSIEIGKGSVEDVFGSGVVTVSYADGTTATADTADVTFTLPDLSTVGEKVILVSYNTTKQGNLSAPVSTYYTIAVTNVITSIAVTANPIYVMDHTSVSAVDRQFDVRQALNVVATYLDNTTAILDASEFTCETVPAKVGTYTVTVAVGETVSQQVNVTVMNSEVIDSGLTGEVGTPDKLTAWWTAFSPDLTVEAGKTLAMKFTNYVGGSNWNTYCVILRRADMSEYAVVRADNYGWGASYDGNENLVASCTQPDFETWLPAMEGANVTVYVTNCGNGICDVVCENACNNSETYYQIYLNLGVDINDLNAALVVDGSYIQF